jgi:hypothetical protein
MLRKYGYSKIGKPIDEIDLIEATRRARNNSSIGANWKQKFDDYQSQECIPSKNYSMFSNQNNQDTSMCETTKPIKTRAIGRGKGRK